MNRREFLQHALAAGALYTGGPLLNVSGSAHAAFAGVTQPILAHLTLLGGPDFRHLFPPAFKGIQTTYGFQHWRARRRSHDLDNVPSTWAARWNNDYYHKTFDGVEFGILRSCFWLNRMWDEGKVAIVNNCYGAVSRDHEHATMVLDQGNLASGPNDRGRSGWGGRLAEALNANVLALTGSPRPFCFGPAADPESASALRVINAADTRNISLYHPAATEESRYSRRASAARALKAYYAARAQALPATSPHREIVDLERKIRVFGEALDDRLATVSVPPELAALYNPGPAQLRNPSFGVQLRNLYDALACNDILGMRVASLDYGGWDTHANQRPLIEYNLRDLFAGNRGLATLHQVLPADARANLVWVIAGEFGRQLRDNGDQGTDHGIGNSVLLIGERVRGGLYGTMFPEAELERMNGWSPDIEGRTAWDHVFGRACDHLQAGAGATVFPERATRPLEAGVDLAGLF